MESILKRILGVLSSVNQVNGVGPLVFSENHALGAIKFYADEGSSAKDSHSPALCEEIEVPLQQHKEAIRKSDEHVQPLTLDDTPELDVTQVYITNAFRAYKLADHFNGGTVFRTNTQQALPVQVAGTASTGSDVSRSRCPPSMPGE